MKRICGIFLSVLLLAGCEKEKKMCCMPPQVSLLGKWVDVNKRQDTLVAYVDGDRPILFDNSEYYRSVQALIYTTQFRFQFQFQDNKVGVRPYTAKTSDPFMYYDFTWIEPGVKFTLLQNAIRPYLSSLPVGTYEKVK